MNLEYIEFDDPAPLMSLEEPVIIQGSQEWHEARAGQISASRICEMLAEGDRTTRNKYKYQLAFERLTGKRMETTPLKNKHIDRGNQLEPFAREEYEIITGNTVGQIAFVKHPTIDMSLASPDSLVNDDGLLEIKCPAIPTHIGYFETLKIPRAYVLQMTWQMACSGRAWCDFMSYCPELPPPANALIIRVERNQGEIDTLERQVIAFNKEIDELVLRLRKAQ